MAKALFGHVGLGPDYRLTAELARLRLRVKDLEDELVRLRKANAALAATVEMHDDVLALTVPDSVPEHAEALA